MNLSKRILRWIGEGKYLYLFIGLVLLVQLANNFKAGSLSTSDNIRVYGLLLQLTGTLTIMHSLKEKLVLFKGFGLGVFLVKYFRSFPWIERKRNLVMKAEAGGISIALGDLRGKVRPKEDLADVIRYFDGEVLYLHKRLADAKEELKGIIQASNAELGEVKSNLGRQIEQTQQLLSASAVSNVWLDFFGISIIFIGLIYGTIPDLVEKLVW